jgi:hypothetical protein
VIRSPVGAIGMMQIMGRVWRGVYDVERLERTWPTTSPPASRSSNTTWSITPSVAASTSSPAAGQPGTRHLRRLQRRTVAPGPLSARRHPGRLRAIDREFWNHYQQMKTEQWPDVASCYAVGQ